MLHRYYCPQRPPEPGAVPKSGLLGVYYMDGPDGPQQVRGCQFPIWGWVDYTRELTADEVRQYGLAPKGA